MDPTNEEVSVLKVIKQQQSEFERGSAQYRFCEACYRACEDQGVTGLVTFLSHMQTGDIKIRDIEYLQGINRRTAVQRGIFYTLLAGSGLVARKKAEQAGRVPPALETFSYIAQIMGCLGAGREIYQYADGYPNFEKIFAEYVKSPELETDMNLILSHLRIHHSDAYNSQGRV